MDDIEPVTAEVMLITEVRDIKFDNFEEKRIRVTGCLIAHDIVQCRAVLSDQNHAVSVSMDTTLIEPCQFVTGSLYQCLGDMRLVGDFPVLRVTAYRCVDGLDIVKYKQALQIHRQFMQQRIRPQ